MALPQEFEVYGATAAPSGARRTTKSMRIALVAGAVVLTMLAAVAFLAKDTEESNYVVDYAVTPEDQLSSLVTDMAVHANSMSLKDMEDRLEEWRNNPNTILDLPQPARTQAKTDVWK